MSFYFKHLQLLQIVLSIHGCDFIRLTDITYQGTPTMPPKKPFDIPSINDQKIALMLYLNHESEIEDRPRGRSNA